MTIKFILVPLPDARLAKTSLKAAINIAGSLAAHIEVLHVRPDSRIIAASYVGETMSASMVEEMMTTTERQAKENARKVRAAFDAACAAQKIRYSAKPSRSNAVTASWHEEVGNEDHWVRSAGRVADLTLLARPERDIDVGARLSLEAALMETGRPLLMAPPKVPARIGTNIAIAWNGSAEAASAVGAAMPFIDTARRVTILTASEAGKEDYNPDGLRQLLAWHGVSAKIERVRTRSDVGKGLLSAAEKAGANLFVMGAYTRSRVRQMIFGGVTSHVLKDAEIPILMAR